jgi:hypothetical protein
MIIFYESLSIYIHGSREEDTFLRIKEERIKAVQSSTTKIRGRIIETSVIDREVTTREIDKIIITGAIPSITKTGLVASL